MIMQAYIDESEEPDDRIILAGYIASAEAWAEFSKKWEAILPFGTLVPTPKDPTFNLPNYYHFKMSEMMDREERTERLPGFFHLINEYALLCISISVKFDDWEKAKSRAISIAGPEHAGFFEHKGPYYAAAFSLMGVTAHFLVQDRAYYPWLEDGVEKLNYFFDERGEGKWILQDWEAFKESRSPEVWGLVGDTPRFVNDRDFPPLQAADSAAWIARKALVINEALDGFSFRDLGIKFFPDLDFVFLDVSIDDLTRSALGQLRHFQKLRERGSR